MTAEFPKTLAVEVRSHGLAYDLSVGAGTSVAVMGPNGAGKTTFLETVAGLVPGSVVLGPADLTRTPSHRRPAALLAQDPLLFPHLSVLDNVAFPLRHRAGLSRAASRAAAAERLADLGVDHLAARRPAHLSGGQAQRVALARALATDPELLLLDEPLAALDVTAVPPLRRALRAAASGRTTLMITHDPLDALAIADELVVVSDGSVAQQGPTAEVLRAPETAFGAALLDQNPWIRTADLDALRG
ncbi:ATP-binding cassette domain-containing protein [Microbacterium indicum]|uniref:ATP-binding cassette domain-containing protein n=1 Tax=Microbacterium indicum TaxID=358100 RepID=UPI0003FA4573|nr:ATP-binding cassette domain-containing protein [Microbacterium indicum]